MILGGVQNEKHIKTKHDRFSDWNGIKKSVFLFRDIT